VAVTAVAADEATIAVMVTVAAAEAAAAEAAVAADETIIRKDTISINRVLETENPNGPRRDRLGSCYFLFAKFSAWCRGSVMIIVVPFPTALFI
jgi:hypothetical protein